MKRVKRQYDNRKQSDGSYFYKEVNSPWVWCPSVVGFRVITSVSSTHKGEEVRNVDQVRVSFGLVTRTRLGI